MKILVSGATGFIGKYVIDELIKHEEITVIATSRNESKAMRLSWYNKIEYIQFDFSSTQSDYYNFFKKPDCFIHLAWEGLPNYKDLFHFERNLLQDYYLIKEMINSGLPQLVVTGTCFEYGMREGCLTENLIPNPTNAYGIAKNTLRQFVELLKKENTFVFQWIRLFYTYGKNQNASSILSQLEIALKNGDEIFNMSKGEQLRDYLPIEEVSENIVTIALQNRVEGIINCCSGTPISIRSLVENKISESGGNIKLNLGYYHYPDFEPLAFWGDNKKLQQILMNPAN
jgi:nucleoside-diphosphate-sugar epimerase